MRCAGHAQGASSGGLNCHCGISSQQVVFCVKHYTSVAATFGVVMYEVDIALSVSARTSTVRHAWFGILFSCLYELLMPRLTMDCNM